MTKTDMWCRACINGKPQIKHDSNTSHDPNIIQRVSFFPQKRPAESNFCEAFCHSKIFSFMYRHFSVQKSETE